MAALELAHLRTLMAVVEVGSFTGAAPLLFLSQSAVSEQIKRLEECVGMPLLVRSKQGVVPTQAGQQLLQHAQQLTALADHALRDVRGEALQGVLRLAITDYFKPDDLTRMLKLLAQQHPGVRFEVNVHKSAEVEAAYTSGACDLGLVMSIVQGKTALDKLGGKEPLVWAAAQGWTHTPGQPLPLLALPEACALRQYAEAQLRKQKIPYVIAHQATGVAGLQSAIAAGLGVACINAAVLNGAVVPWTGRVGLPRLQLVQFGLLAARGRESAFLQRVRALLRQQWA